MSISSLVRKKNPKNKFEKTIYFCILLMMQYWSVLADSLQYLGKTANSFVLIGIQDQRADVFAGWVLIIWRGLHSAHKGRKRCFLNSWSF
jgi:hypothetical protein